MAWPPRTFSRRSHVEAKAGENIGQGKPRENVIKKANQTNQREQISKVLLTRSPSRLVGVLRLLPRSRHTRFSGCGLLYDRAWREGVLSFKHRRCNETNKYHPAQQSPHENDWLPGNENVHARPLRTKSGSRLALLYCDPPDFSWTSRKRFIAQELQTRRQQRQESPARKPPPTRRG